MILNGYVEKVRAMALLAQRHGFRLTPERIYRRLDGTVDVGLMIDPIHNIYLSLGTLSQDLSLATSSNTMTVEAFIKYASEINAFDFGKKYKRPMNPNERELAIETKSVCHAISNYLRIFRNISLLSEKYMGLESYVIYRMYQLVNAPTSFHHFMVSEEN